ncbi:MAG: hypothetical protein GF308_22115 [Candidatus Heimdallarchaeota archaeon]|nr:hypothetical protein [Candidatus Heimdallarchaeota archaeon]
MSPRFRPRRVIRRRRRRFIRRRTRRFLLGSAIIFALAGTHRAYKMREPDVVRLENHYGRPVEELTEDEIVTGMRQLGIKKIELDDEDRAVIYEADDKDEGLSARGKKYCSNCGDIIDKGEIYCDKCGVKL